MNRRDIIVIGASAGGFEGIKQVVSDLPADLDAAVFIVWHMAADVRGILPQVLNGLGTMKAAHAIDDEIIVSGRIYVAPPDRHLLVEAGRVKVTRGPKENLFRPAVDPLFRSAALAYGARVIGLVLSGALDDGTAGMWAIKQQGGLAVVQDPADAQVSSMPANVINAVKVDYIVPVKEVGALLSQLVKEQAAPDDTPESDFTIKARMEVRIAMKNEDTSRELLRQGHLTPYTCPECHGVLTALSEEQRIRFRCHTGHAFSADSLLTSITTDIEKKLWAAIRTIQESMLLLNHIGDHFAEANETKVAAAYFTKAKEAMQRAALVRKALLDHEQLDMDSVKDQADMEYFS